MNILLCGNEKVFDGALTELISITNKTKEPVKCYIFTMDLSRIKQEYISIKDEQICICRPLLVVLNHCQVIQIH